MKIILSPQGPGVSVAGQLIAWLECNLSRVILKLFVSFRFCLMSQ